MIPLSAATQLRIEALFPPEERGMVAQLLVERCGETLPLSDRASPEFWDRIRFAVLKLSEGRMENLRATLESANRDWRDILVAAGFAQSLTVHRDWLPSKQTQPS